MLKSELAFESRCFCLAAAQKLMEHGLVQLPGAVLIGVAEGRSPGRFLDAQVAQFAFARRQASGDLSQALGVTQLAKQHGDELGSTAEAPRVALGLVLSNGVIKQGAWNQRQDLAENAAYSIQGGAPSGCWISWQNSIATDRRRRLLGLVRRGASPSPPSHLDELIGVANLAVEVPSL